MRKSQSGKSVPVPTKTKMAFSLSPKAVKRLGAACVFYDENQSQLVERIINEQFAGLRVVDDRAKTNVPAIATDSAIQGHEINSLAQVA
jgi:hypothetical protein